jgi:hypothetical protein
VIFGITMVKDEADIIEYTIEHLLSQGVDHILAFDNMSTDGTTEILDSWDGDVTWWTDPEIGYHQARKMTDLAQRASEAGADWIVPFDADEIWHIPNLEVWNYDVVELRSHVYLPRFANDAVENPLLRMQWRCIEPEQYPKVAFRWKPGVQIAMGNHSVSYPGGWGTYPASHSWADGFRIRHYQYRTLDQVRRKVANGAAAYAAAPELAAGHGSHWQWLASLDEAGLQAWWASYQMLAEITHDPYRWPKQTQE